MILPHVFFICFYYSSNTSALPSSWIGAASPHTSIYCHWNQLTLGQQTQDLVTTSTTCKQKCCSDKSHPSSLISPYIWYNVPNALITATYEANNKQPFWQEQTIFPLKSVELNQYEYSCWSATWENILRRTHISALLFGGAGDNMSHFMQASLY